MQNSSAAPSLEETIDFLVNGPNDSWVYERKHEWSIDDNCVLKIKRDAIKLSETYSMKRVDRIIYLNKVNLKKGVRRCAASCSSCSPGGRRRLKNGPSHRFQVKLSQRDPNQEIEKYAVLAFVSCLMFSACLI